MSGVGGECVSGVGGECVSGVGVMSSLGPGSCSWSGSDVRLESGLGVPDSTPGRKCCELEWW